MRNLNVVMGIDQSLTHTGYSVFDLGERLVSCSILTDKRRGAERLSYIKTELDYVLLQFIPSIICLEGYSFGSKGRALTGLHELGGVVRLLAYERDIPLYEVAPTALKKYMCGPGNGFAPKEQVMCEIYDKYDLQFDDDNEADAFVLGLIAHQLNLKLNKGAFSNDIEQHQLEVLNQIVCTQMEDD